MLRHVLVNDARGSVYVTWGGGIKGLTFGEEGGPRSCEGSGGLGAGVRRVLGDWRGGREGGSGDLLDGCGTGCWAGWLTGGIDRDGGGSIAMGLWGDIITTEAQLRQRGSDPTGRT